MEVREVLKTKFEVYFGDYMDLKEELDRQIESGTLKGDRLKQALFHINAAQDMIRQILEELKEGENENNT